MLLRGKRRRVKSDDEGERQSETARTMRAAMRLTCGLRGRGVG